MSINRLYHTWFEQIEQLWPNLRVTQLRNFTWLAIGIYLSKKVHLSKIAGKIPGKAKRPSVTRRLNRFLCNKAIRARQLYTPVATQILQAHVRAGEVRLILDCTDNHPELALREGVLALQLHAGKPMWAEYKNIRLKHRD